jgi:DNA-binding response OmpR family regulator
MRFALRTLMASPLPADSQLHPNLRVLIAEDDPEVAQSLHLYLQLLSCRVDLAPDGSQALERAIKGDYDVIVLDLSLPSMDGLAVCKSVRQHQVFTPILILTARGSDGDKAIGLNAGADDYMTKPFSPLELQARLHALMRRASYFSRQQRAASRIEVDDLAIDVDQRTVAVAERRVALTAREFDLLAALARHPGRVYTREQLLDLVWGYGHDGYGHTVNSHVNRLRAKIEDDPANPRYILTVWSIGYKFRER